MFCRYTRHLKSRFVVRWSKKTAGVSTKSMGSVCFRCPFLCSEFRFSQVEPPRSGEDVTFHLSPNGKAVWKVSRVSDEVLAHKKGGTPKVCVDSSLIDCPKVQYKLGSETAKPGRGMGCSPGAVSSTSRSPPGRCQCVGCCARGVVDCLGVSEGS